jgi:hypothetical protein
MFTGEKKKGGGVESFHHYFYTSLNSKFETNLPTLSLRQFIIYNTDIKLIEQHVSPNKDYKSI